MDSQPQAELTVGDMLIWIGMTLDNTDKIAAIVPEALLDWRPEDPTGGFQFSLAEILMHCADARFMFAGQLTGEELAEKYWTPEGPDEKGVWQFKPYGSKQAILDSLKESRALYTEFLSWPVSRLHEVSEGAQAGFEKMLEQVKEHGGDVEKMMQRGPADLNRVLMAVAVHEAGHRGSLYTLLRMNGVALGPEE